MFCKICASSRYRGVKVGFIFLNWVVAFTNDNINLVRELNSSPFPCLSPVSYWWNVYIHIRITWVLTKYKRKLVKYEIFTKWRLIMVVSFGSQILSVVFSFRCMCYYFVSWIFMTLSPNVSNITSIGVMFVKSCMDICMSFSLSSSIWKVFPLSVIMVRKFLWKLNV